MNFKCWANNWQHCSTSRLDLGRSAVVLRQHPVSSIQHPVSGTKYPGLPAAVAINYLSRRRVAPEFHDCGTKADRHLSVVSGQWSVVCSLRELLSDFLKLLTEYRSVKAINSDACPPVCGRPGVASVVTALYD